MTLSRALRVVLAAACCALPARAAPKPAKAPAASPEYSLPEGRFAVTPPAGWTASRDARDDARQKVYGVQLSGPRAADGVLPTISIAWYAPDNTLFKGGLPEFLKRNLGNDERFVPPAGETTSPARKTALGGLPASAFTRRTHEYLPPGAADGREVAIVEEVEAAAAKEGFYVLEFKASAADSAALKRAYSKVRASLRFSAPPAGR